MRLARLRSLFFGAAALLLAGTLTGCENPLEPLNKSDKIEGLSYVDFSATWDRWDSDPEYDGVLIEVSYYNSLGDTLTYYDKPHKITVEFWSQHDVGTETSPFLARNKLLYSASGEITYSDANIYIPFESYLPFIRSTIDETSGEGKGFVIVRVFPPDEFPLRELEVAQPDIVFYKQQAAESTPNP